ncbi:MAG: A/G-specific adenine glycosylase [Sphingomonadaceae bacterium]|nr:A/G-specific adenine glycosylase [Sphingomonadaceae bacterium]
MAEAGAGQRQGFDADLLRWYDANARVLPWRAPPGTPAPDPYRVWLSEVMLQQTTAAAVAPRFSAWVERWPTLGALAAAGEAEVMAAWAGLGYYARARNLLACARVVAASGGFPCNEAGLRALPGLGDYTAPAVAAIAFGEMVVPVDANIARVTARVFAESASRARLRCLIEPLAPAERPGDFAQALMDLGSRICTPRNPRCGACPVRSHCAAAQTGQQAAYPAARLKAVRPVRRGIAFWFRRGDEVLTVRRPPRGLLGGMRALPSSDWVEACDERAALAAAPANARWRLIGGISHVFTHFALDLSVFAAAGDADGEWLPVAGIESEGLPAVFLKAARLALADEAGVPRQASLQLARAA